ncbi:MAG: hypothetical protein M1826_004147 [Phylliscum demangeonii]|nr:MAG: hypothetical protein M1826_004147 [Phylliscum demangeonii]
MCGSTERLWAFDRTGAVASSSFDINKHGLEFVKATLGFLFMDEAALGFDPSIKEDGQRFIEIARNGETERLILECPIFRGNRSIVCRASTVWKAYRKSDKTPP